jgi:hypothetical protein
MTIILSISINGGKEEALPDTLLSMGSDEGQEIKRDGTFTPGYTSEYEE